MAKKKPPRKSASPRKADEKPLAKEPATAEVKVPEFTPELRRIWLRIRKTYNISLQAFSNALSALNDKEANILYDLVRLSLYKDNPAQIIKAHPFMKEFIRTDDDRLCMHDIYENLSWRLGRKEPAPKHRQMITRFRVAVKGSAIP